MGKTNPKNKAMLRSRLRTARKRDRLQSAAAVAVVHGIPVESVKDEDAEFLAGVGEGVGVVLPPPPSMSRARLDNEVTDESKSERDPDKSQ